MGRDGELVMATDYGRWTYGDAGDRWPVEPGEVWGVGPHLIACGDLEDTGPAGAEAAMTRMLAGRTPAACYVDPPWNSGNARSFRTKAAVGRPVDFPALLDRVAAVASASPDVFVEMGKAGVAAAIESFTVRGLSHVGSWPATYYGKSPCVLMRFTADTATRAVAVPDGCDDEDLPGIAFTGLPPGSVVIDPCTGRGLTATHAERRNLTFVGTELHPRRMAVALDKLHQAGAGTPSRVPDLEGSTA